MAESEMSTVVFEIASLDRVKKRVAAAFRGEPQGQFISFNSVELFSSILTPKRWEIIKAMTGQGPMSIREAARRVGRDVKAVHGDVHALINAGVLNRTEDGKVVFPYDAVHVDFTITKAA
ncbi:transcriptional regulator [Aquibium sp. LZ166]|mgnify:CR=1 FL=1|uniref:Transcriptional regulator n=1 Tax=Aquibium pacificus TaxID=3153579 RepID=A0ABV3SNP7_9HYPH